MPSTVPSRLCADTSSTVAPALGSHATTAPVGTAHGGSGSIRNPATPVVRHPSPASTARMLARSAAPAAGVTRNVYCLDRPPGRGANGCEAGSTVQPSGTASDSVAAGTSWPRAATVTRASNGLPATASAGAATDTDTAEVAT